MDRARIHEGIRRMRFTDILGRSERSELSQMEAAELLGILARLGNLGVLSDGRTEVPIQPRPDVAEEGAGVRVR